MPESADIHIERTCGRWVVLHVAKLRLGRMDECGPMQSHGLPELRNSVDLVRGMP